MDQNFKYKKIIILGGSGSGKSTLANRIGLFTGYPVYHLDQLFLDSNWKLKDKEERINICKKEFLSKEFGVVDGNYHSTVIPRIEWSDLIIFLNVPTYIKLYRIFKRLIESIFGINTRKGVLGEAKANITWKHIKWVYNWNSSHVDKYLDLFKSIKDKKVLIIKEPMKLNLEELFK